MSEEAIVDFGPKGVGRVLCLVDRNDNPLGDDEPEANAVGFIAEMLSGPDRGKHLWWDIRGLGAEITPS
jgi:hypothetical protein